MLQGIGAAASPLPKRALISLATRSQASALRLEITTFAPCSAIRSAIALPMPLVDPVMRAILPLRSNRLIFPPLSMGPSPHLKRYDAQANKSGCLREGFLRQGLV